MLIAYVVIAIFLMGWEFIGGCFSTPRIKRNASGIFQTILVCALWPILVIALIQKLRGKL